MFQHTGDLFLVDWCFSCKTVFHVLQIGIRFVIFFQKHNLHDKSSESSFVTFKCRVLRNPGETGIGICCIDLICRIPHLKAAMENVSASINPE